MRRRRSGRWKHQLQFAGDQCGERGTRALVVDAHDIDLRHRPEHFRGKMVRRAGARRTVVQSARLRFGEGDKFGDGLRRQRGIDNQHIHCARDRADRREIAQHIVGRCLNQRRRPQRVVVEQQCVAVGAAFATISAGTTPLGRFSITTCCPSASVRPCATIRAGTSLPPPASDVTMRKGFTGYSAAFAPATPLNSMAAGNQPILRNAVRARFISAVYPAVPPFSAPRIHASDSHTLA